MRTQPQWPACAQKQACSHTPKLITCIATSIHLSEISSTENQYGNRCAVGESRVRTQQQWPACAQKQACSQTPTSMTCIQIYTSQRELPH